MEIFTGIEDFGEGDFGGSVRMALFVSPSRP